MFVTLGIRRNALAIVATAGLALTSAPAFAQEAKDPNPGALTLTASFDGPSARLLERLLLTIAGVVDSRVGAIPKLVIAEAGNFPDLARFYLDEVVRRGLRLIGTILRRGIQRGEFRPVDIDHTVFCVIAPMVIAALWKNSLEPHDDAPLDAQALARAHLELLLRGLEARGQ